MRVKQLLKVLDDELEIEIDIPDEYKRNGYEYIGRVEDLPYYKYMNIKNLEVFDQTRIENGRLIIPVM